MKSCCSRSLVKLMQSCSKLFILKFSKPKMSSSPMLYESSCWSDARRPAGPPIPAPASAAFSRATMWSNSAEYTAFASASRVSPHCDSSRLTVTVSVPPPDGTSIVRLAMFFASPASSICSSRAAFLSGAGSSACRIFSAVLFSADVPRKVRLPRRSTALSIPKSSFRCSSFTPIASRMRCASAHPLTSSIPGATDSPLVYRKSFAVVPRPRLHASRSAFVAALSRWYMMWKLRSPAA